MPAKEKNRQEKQKQRGEEKGKEKVKTVVSFVTKKISKFCFLWMPKLWKLVFCVWNRRPHSA